MIRQLACIVEGHGEVEALPVLVRRVALEVRPLEPPPDVSVFRVPKSKLLLPGELERNIETATRRAHPRGAVLVLLDSDEDCPAELAPESRRRRAFSRHRTESGEVGPLKVVSNRSGHYRPSGAHVDQMLALLAEEGVDASGVTRDYLEEGTGR